MNKVSIAVCDTDSAYGERLAEWLSLEKKSWFLGCSFSSPELFEKAHQEKEFDIVLLGKGFANNPGILAELEQDEDSNTPLWIYLYDPEEEVSEAVSSLPVIEKYQPAFEIVRELFQYYQGIQEKNNGIVTEHCELLGIYSPVHSIWQTPFAVSAAEALSKGGEVLYVNLQECAGFSRWFLEEYQRDLLDVMYLSLTNEEQFPACLQSSVYTMESFDYIPPAVDGACLSEIAGEDYVKFIRLLVEKSRYHVVVLELGMMLPGFFQLLEQCSRIDRKSVV